LGESVAYWSSDNDLFTWFVLAGAGGGDRLQKKIRELQQELADAKEHLRNQETDNRKVSLLSVFIITCKISFLLLNLLCLTVET
jgi:hypothetical protein